MVCIPDENGKDQGINVRQKVKEMIEFVQDDDRLREERKKAKKNRDKYIGVSSDSMSGFRYCKSQDFLIHLTHIFCFVMQLDVLQQTGDIFICDSV